MFKNIVVGLSGGVDSTVAALLLKRKGFNVTAVFLRNWDTADETGKCLADEDYKDAEYVSKKLDIPLIEVNFVKEYWHDVFSYLLDGYQTGYTPNPDIMCNKNIKFNKFYNYAIQNLKADAVATGHYARSSFGSYLENYNSNIKVRLLKAADQHKDQTFFLSQVNQTPLQRCMFPLGDYQKTDVKKIAREAGFEIIADKDESMGICFIGNRTFQNFISEYVEDKPGNFIDCETGKIVGQHQGIHHWTLGQRTRISGAATAYFVYRKDPQSNDILVAQGTHHPALFTRIIITSKPHWICEQPEKLSDNCTIFNCEFTFQHRCGLVPCRIFNSISDRLIIDLKIPQRAVSPGQFAVLYLGDECLGSAPILHTGPSLYTLGETLSEDIILNDKISKMKIHNV